MYHIVPESDWRNIDLSAIERDLGDVPSRCRDEAWNMIPNKNAPVVGTPVVDR